ncbi:MAG: polysaccharide biosynthesis/export family protein [Crocinitomicaceae bacterium]
MAKVYLTKISIVFLLFSFLQSCGVNSDLMLKTPKDYVFESLDSLRESENNMEYIIHIDDIIEFNFQIRKGSRILDMSAGTLDEVGAAGANRLIQNSGINYVVQTDSLVKLPYINEVNLVGKTIREAEQYLQKSYESFYVDPFIQLRVTNKRVFVFPGSGGDAQVVNLLNNNTTLVEVIALAGGIRDRGRASKIKLIRESNGERKVYLIDLSTIEGLDNVDLIVQNGDYIYVEPTPQLGREIFSEVAPIFSILTSTFAVIFGISKL